MALGALIEGVRSHESLQQMYTSVYKEILRFLKVVIQTIISPLVTALLFLLVLSLAIGNERGGALGFPFITFLAPGLIAMQIIQQAFSHTSSSIIIGTF